MLCSLCASWDHSQQPYLGALQGRGSPVPAQQHPGGQQCHHEPHQSVHEQVGLMHHNAKQPALSRQGMHGYH